jgi:hypothetical protein
MPDRPAPQMFELETGCLHCELLTAISLHAAGAPISATFVVDSLCDAIADIASRTEGDPVADAAFAASVGQWVAEKLVARRKRDVLRSASGSPAAATLQ